MPIARIINQAKYPLVISDIRNNNGDIEDGMVGSVLSLSYLLDSKVQLQLIFEPNIPKIAGGFSNVFLFSRHEVLSQKIAQEQNRKSVLVYKGKTNLWELDRIKTNG